MCVGLSGCLWTQPAMLRAAGNWVSETDPSCRQQERWLFEELPPTSFPQAKTFCRVNGSLLGIGVLSQKTHSEADLP